MVVLEKAILEREQKKKAQSQLASQAKVNPQGFTFMEEESSASSDQYNFNTPIVPNSQPYKAPQPPPPSKQLQQSPQQVSQQVIKPKPNIKERELQSFKSKQSKDSR